MMLEQEIEKYLSGQTLCNCDSVSYRNIKNLILGFAEPREKRIEELKKENNVLAQNLEDTEILNKTYEKRFDDLEKENAELKEELNYAKSHCLFNSDCPTQKENAELKEELNYAKSHCLFNSDCPTQKENAELKEENKKWKDEWQEQVQEATEEGYARTLQTIQLAKAIEIIKKYYKYNPSCEYFYEDIDKEAEQFLKGCEVVK